MKKPYTIQVDYTQFHNEQGKTFNLPPCYNMKIENMQALAKYLLKKESQEILDRVFLIIADVALIAIIIFQHIK